MLQLPGKTVKCLIYFNQQRIKRYGLHMHTPYIGIASGKEQEIIGQMLHAVYLLLGHGKKRICVSII